MSSHHQKLDPSDPRNYYCRNCNHNHGTVDVHFCANCGQKNTDGRSSMHEIGHEFLHNTLHLDGKFFKMLRHLFLPGKLTADFFMGRQKRYPHPTRFFLVIVALFLYLMNAAGGMKVNVNYAPSEVRNKDKFLLGEAIRDTFAALPQNLRTPESMAALDSIFEKNDLGSPEDSTTMGNFGKTFAFLTTDYYHLTPDSLIKKYKIGGFFEKNALKQAIKASEDPKSVVHAWLGTMTGTILLLLALMSPVLMLLYRRTRPFYVEHFIFLMHHTTTLLLGMSIFLLLAKIGWFDFFAKKALLVWWLGWMTAGMLIAMKRFYGRKWPEIVWKWLVFSVIYAAVGIGAVFLSLMVAFFFLL